MIRENDNHPVHAQDKLEAALLAAAAELHPAQLQANELISKVVGNRNDPRQVKTAFRGIGCLREYGVIADRQDGIVQLTPAALRAVALLTVIAGDR